MNFEQIIEFFTELEEAKDSRELDWNKTGNLRFETNWNGQDVIVDKRNNIDKESLEIYLKVDDFEFAYLPASEEFDYLNTFIESLEWNL